MPTTPLRGWTYPTEGQDPYWETIVDFFEEQDADVDAALTGRRLYTLTSGDSSAITNTTTETAFDKTFTVPANALSTVGARIIVSGYGYHSTDTVEPQLRLRVRLGGSGKDLFNRNGSPQASAASFGWCVRAEGVVRTAGASGLIQPGYGHYQLVGGDTLAPSATSFSLDTTTTQVVDLTATWTIANANNTVNLVYLAVEIILPTGTF